MVLRTFLAAMQFLLCFLQCAPVSGHNEVVARGHQLQHREEREEREGKGGEGRIGRFH